jgi:parvulin-like peptidyl-prolyl isomerase
MTTLNLELTKKIQETRNALRGNQEDKSWEIDEKFETEESWNQRQNELLSKLSSYLNQATKEDLIAILDNRVFDGQYSEKSIYTY